MHANIFPTNFEKALEHYNNCIKTAIDKHAPRKAKKIKKVPSCPWFDHEYVQLRRRRKAERLFKKNKLSEHNTFYAKLKRQCLILAREKKVIHFRQKIDNALKQQRCLFKTIKKLSGHEHLNNYPSNYANDIELANEFAKFFIHKIEEVHLSINNKSTSAMLSKCTISANNSLIVKPNLISLNYFELATSDEITEIISQNGLKCSFPDPCPDSILRNNLSFFIPIWTQLVYLSLLEGSMNGLKHAFVTPLIKNLSLDSEQFKNFRPVSNLHFIGKLIEHVVFRCLSTHLDRNDLNVFNQYGYKKGHSCETLLLKLVNDILKGFESNFATVLFLI